MINNELENEIEEKKSDMGQKVDDLNRQFQEYKSEVTRLEDVCKAYELTCNKSQAETSTFISVLRLLVDIAHSDKIKDKHKIVQYNKILLGLRLPERKNGAS